MRVLLAEDQQRLADLLARGLRREGLAVDVAHAGDDALEKADVVRYDVVVLDRDLPGVHGDDVCRRLVGEADPPRILMLTAADALGDRVAGLNLGADDYLTKPFAFSELVARVRALGRRAGRSQPVVLERGGLRLDPGRRQVTRGGGEIDLAPKEFAVLEELLRADGRVLSAEHLLATVWDEQLDPFSHTVRQTLLRLRRKLGEPPLIETVKGVGYRVP